MGIDDQELDNVIAEDESSDSHNHKGSDGVTKPTTTTPPLSYRDKALANGVKYTVTDVPPLPQAIMLGVQHYLTMLGATVLIPLILCPAMGASGSQTAEVISSIFFISGINTLIQTSIGDRYVYHVN